MKKLFRIRRTGGSSVYVVADTWADAFNAYCKQEATNDGIAQSLVADPESVEMIAVNAGGKCSPQILIVPEE